MSDPNITYEQSRRTPEYAASWRYNDVASLLDDFLQDYYHKKYGANWIRLMRLTLLVWKGHYSKGLAQ